MHDGNPLPSFEGEPKLVGILDDMDAFTDMLWNLSLIHIWSKNITLQYIWKSCPCGSFSV